MISAEPDTATKRIAYGDQYHVNQQVGLLAEKKSISHKLSQKLQKLLNRQENGGKNST